MSEVIERLDGHRRDATLVEVGHRVRGDAEVRYRPGLGRVHATQPDVDKVLRSQVRLTLPQRGEPLVSQAEEVRDRHAVHVAAG